MTGHAIQAACSAHKSNGDGSVNGAIPVVLHFVNEYR